MDRQELTERPISSEEIYHGKVVHLFRDQIELPNGETAVREVVRHPGAAAVVALNARNEICLVRQYRYPFAQVMLEIPAGKLDPGESPDAAARRELEEETGLCAGRLTPLGAFCPSVAILDEVIHLYLATELSTGKVHLDEDEFLNVSFRPLRETVEDICAGRIRDGKTQAAVLKAWLLLGADGGVAGARQPDSGR